MYAKTLLTLIVLTLMTHTGLAQDQNSTDSLTHQLQEIIVTARQPATKLVGSTLISTIPGSNLATLGNALDVLAHLPMISVEDNTVNVIGRNNIEIFIDGRPMRNDQELQQILSSNLKKVELIMAPGAAYQSTTGAVLKITTKKNFAHGLSLTEQFRLSRRRKWSTTNLLGLSYRTGNWEFSIDGSINSDNTLTKGTTTNTFMYEGRHTEIGGNQQNSTTATTGSTKAGFSYTKDAQSFGMYYRYNPEQVDFTNNGTEWFGTNVPIRRIIDRRIHTYNHMISAYYENTFANKYLLHFDGDFSLSRDNSSVNTAYPESTNTDVNSSNLRKSTLVAGKLYLTLPLWGGDFTIGSQDSYTHTTLDYQMLNDDVEQYIPSSRTEASQISAAIFASWSRAIGKLSISAGARYEYVDYDFKINGKRDAYVSRRDHLITPDLSLGYFFNEDSQISLSYKMSTVRPPYSQLTGSLNYVGLHEIEGGNPSLRDEKMHNFQLFGTWNGFILQTDFIRSLDTYTYVKQLYPAKDLQLLMHPVNINISALSLYIIWSKAVRRWTPNVTIGMYRQWLTLGEIKYNRPIFSYYFDNTLSLPGGWLLTAGINGSSRGDMHTNRFGSTLMTMNASVGKTFFNKSLTVKLSATDIFNTANNNWTMNTFGIYVDKRQRYDRRGISLNIIYNLHPRKSRYRGTSASEAELKRL